MKSDMQSELTTDQLANNLLHDFLDRALPIGDIATRHNESIDRVLAAIASPLARVLLKSVARAEKLRLHVLDLRARARALHGLTDIVESCDNSSTGRETRRRAADAILRATAPLHRSRPSTRTSQPNPPERPEPSKRSDETASRLPPPISLEDWPEHLRQLQQKNEQAGHRRQQQTSTPHPAPQPQHPQSRTTPQLQSPNAATIPSSLSPTPISSIQSAAGAPIQRPTPSSSTLETVPSVPSQYPTSEIPHPTSPPPNSYPSP